MKKEEKSALYEIDNMVRDTMLLLDRKGFNLFFDNFSLIMDFSPYVDRVVVGKNMRTPEHRLVFILRGAATIDVNLERHQLRRGSLLLIPSNSIISMQELSSDYAPITLAFLSSKVESLGLMSYKSFQMQLPEPELKIMQNYCSLLDSLARRGEVGLKSMDFLILSLLVHVQELRKLQCPEKVWSRQAKSVEVADKFLYILNSEAPVRNVEHYARRLNVSVPYLRNAVNKYTGNSPSKWINDRALKEVQLLLLDSDKYYSLDEIAQLTDCGSASQLIKFFKKHTGITPNAYRKKFM